MKTKLLLMSEVMKKTVSKKEVYEKSVTKAFKPIIDIIESALKGARPFVIMFAALMVVLQIFKALYQFQHGERYQRQVYSIFVIIFCATLILTYNTWLIPILKKVAGL